MVKKGRLSNPISSLEKGPWGWRTEGPETTQECQILTNTLSLLSKFFTKMVWKQKPLSQTGIINVRRKKDLRKELIAHIKLDTSNLLFEHKNLIRLSTIKMKFRWGTSQNRGCVMSGLKMREEGDSEEIPWAGAISAGTDRCGQSTESRLWLQKCSCTWVLLVQEQQHHSCERSPEQIKHSDPKGNSALQERTTKLVRKKK